MSDLRQAFREAVAALAAEPAFASHLGPCGALALWDPWGRLVWTSPEASSLERVLVVHPDGTLDPSVPALPRLKVLARGGAPRAGLRLERLRFDPSRLAQPSTCACRIVSIPSGEEALLTVFIGGVPKLTALRRSATPPPQAVPPAKAPPPADASEPAPAEAAPSASPAPEPALSDPPPPAPVVVEHAAEAEPDPGHPRDSGEEEDAPAPSDAVFLDEAPAEATVAAVAASPSDAAVPEQDLPAPAASQPSHDRDRTPEGAEPPGPPQAGAHQPDASDAEWQGGSGAVQAAPDGEPSTRAEEVAATEEQAQPASDVMWADELEGAGASVVQNANAADGAVEDPAEEPEAAAPSDEAPADEAVEANPEADQRGDDRDRMSADRSSVVAEGAGGAVAPAGEERSPEAEGLLEPEAGPEHVPSQADPSEPDAGPEPQAEHASPTDGMTASAGSEQADVAEARQDGGAPASVEPPDGSPDPAISVIGVDDPEGAEERPAEEPGEEPEVAPVRPEAASEPGSRASTAAGAPPSDPILVMDEPDSLAAIAAPEPPPEPPVDPVAHLRGRGTVRFVWQADPESRFTAVSEALASVVGEASAAVVGLAWGEVLDGPVADPVGIVRELLDRRETWSGRTVLWRISGTDLAVEVDLAGMPALGRDRELLGFRGFGLCRTDQIVPFRRPPPEPPLPPLPDAEDFGGEGGIDDAPPGPQGAGHSLAPDPGAAGNHAGDRTPLDTFQAAPGPDEPDPAVLAADVIVDGVADAGPETEADVSAQVSEVDALAEGLFEAEPVEEPGAGEPIPEPQEADSSPPSAEADAPVTPGLDGEPMSGQVVQADAPLEREADRAEPAAEAAEADPDVGEDPVAVDGEPEAEPVEPEPTSVDVPAAAPAGAVDRETGPEGDKGSVPDARASSSPASGRGGTARELRRMRREARAAQGSGVMSLGGPVPAFLGEPPRVPLREVDLVEEVMFEVESFELTGTEVTPEAGPEAAARPDPMPAETGRPAEASAGSEGGLSEAERVAFREIGLALGVAPAEAGASDRAEAAAGLAEGMRLLDALPIGILVHRGDTPLVANRAFLAMSGFADLDQFRAEGGVARVFRGRVAGVSRDGTEGAQTILASRSNESSMVEVRLAAIDWDGAPAELMLVRRLPEADPNQRLRGLELDLRSRESRVRELTSILDTATDGVIVLDDAGRILSLNRSAEALFGYDQNEVTGDGLTVLLAPESHVIALDYLDGLRANGVASLLNDGREVIGRVRQGGAIPLFMTMGRVSDGPDRKFCAVLRDITAFKKAEAELLQAKRAAEESNAQKSDFLAKVSHEIRTPLNAIIGFAEVMLEERFGPVGNERYRDYLRDIHSSGGHVISLVNDLLDLAKIEAGRMELSFTGVSLNELIQACVTLMQPQASRDRIVVRTSFAQRLPPVVADERSIRQIALNLISNAIKFTDAGGQVIVSTALTDRGEVAFRVRDTGIGMSAQEVEAALEPFRQLSTSRRSDGTGLGLPLTKALIEANRGTLQITSAKDEGTLVEVLFPPTRVLAE